MELTLQYVLFTIYMYMYNILLVSTVDCIFDMLILFLCLFLINIIIMQTHDKIGPSNASLW